MTIERDVVLEVVEERLQKFRQEGRLLDDAIQRKRASLDSDQTYLDSIRAEITALEAFVASRKEGVA